MSKKFAQQKAALTRALKTGSVDKVIMATAVAVDEWATHPEFGYWPDDWARWQRALDDVGAYATLDEIDNDVRFYGMSAQAIVDKYR